MKRRSNRSWALRISEVVTFCTIAGMLLLNLSFYFVASPVPDPASGRTYQVQMHGPAFVQPELGILSNISFVAAMLSFAPLLFFYNRDRNREDAKK